MKNIVLFLSIIALLACQTKTANAQTIKTTSMDTINKQSSDNYIATINDNDNIIYLMEIKRLDSVFHYKITGNGDYFLYYRYRDKIDENFPNVYQEHYHYLHIIPENDIYRFEVIYNESKVIADGKIVGFGGRPFLRWRPAGTSQNDKLLATKIMKLWEEMENSSNKNCQTITTTTKQRGYFTIFSSAVVFMMILLCVGGAFWSLKTPVMLRIFGVKTEGVVHKERFMKIPKVIFEDATGKECSFTALHAPDRLVTGDKVTVFYNKKNPKKACTGCFTEYVLGIIALAAGALLFLLLWFIWYKNYTGVIVWVAGILLFILIVYIWLKNR
jgi:hypothetical protein